jgi:carboxyl-terminal processing protease
MIVVVDQGTASAAEIVAGALKDSGRAQILGLPTYGKGSIQTFLDLADGSGMKLTTARFHTPAGHVIEGAGITPHVHVEAFEGEDITAGDDTQVTVETEEEENPDARTDLARTWGDDLQLRTAYQTMKGWLVSK